MEDNNNQLFSIPFVVYESTTTKMERCIKRLIIALVISIVLMFASNAIWLWAWNQYDYTSEEVTYSQDGAGLNNINTGTQGDVRNEPKTNGQETNENQEER